MYQSIVGPTSMCSMAERPFPHGVWRATAPYDHTPRTSSRLKANVLRGALSNRPFLQS
jgi:hypothetical protein